MPSLRSYPFENAVELLKPLLHVATGRTPAKAVNERRGRLFTDEPRRRVVEQVSQILSIAEKVIDVDTPGLDVVRRRRIVVDPET